MQMKNVLDRLTELAKENPSPDVKQAMENTRRMSVVEGADVVEIHEGAMDPGLDMEDRSTEMAEGSAQTYTVLAWKNSTNDSPDVEELDIEAGYARAMAQELKAEGYKVVKIKKQDVAEGQLDELSPATIDSYRSKAQGQAAWAGGVAKALGAQRKSARPEDPKYRDSNWTDPNADYGPEGNKYAKLSQKRGAGIRAASRRGSTAPAQPYDFQRQGGYGDKTNPAIKGVAEGEGNVAIGQQMANDGITYSPEKENELIGLMAQYMKKSGMSPKEIRHYLSYDEDYISDQLSYLPRKGQQGMAEGYFKDRDVQNKDSRLAGTKAYHAKKKAGKEQTATDAKTAFDAKFGGGNPASALKIREQSVTEGVNFAEMHRDKHTTLDEMLNELHDDIRSFKECGHMSEKLRDFMEVHHYGQKQLMDAAYGPVDELADMTKLAGVPGPIGQPGEELAESPGIMIDGKEVDIDSLALAGVDYRDAPDYSDAYLEDGNFVDGTMMSADELQQFMDAHPEIIQDMAYEQAIGAGDDYHDRQQDMELDEVSDGDNGLADAHANARQVSGEHGVAQHVNRDPESGYHRASDWYVDGETVASYNNGKSYDDTGYLDEEDELAGDENSIAQKAQGIEAVTGQKITQLNPTQITQAGQKVDAIQNVREGRELVDECDMTGSPMQPNTPANINISASAASGDEVASMIGDLLRLAGRPESVGPAVGQPGIMAIDSTMDDGGGAAELAAMLNGDAVVDEAGEAGGFADATTTPDELVYGENPVLTQTGVQKHSLGGYRNGDSPLAAATELEESLWRKFQNQ